ncbi:integrase [Nitrospira sp.]|nr:integrase [Nitrospira sp.]
MKLTKKVIDAMKPPAMGQVFVRDGELRGFALRVTPGSKSFVLERSIHGRVRRLTLGRYGEITVEQARDLAKKKIGEIADGKDPAERRKLQRQSMTWGELETLYLERHGPNKKSIGNDITILEKHLASWRPRRLTSITRADICARHADMGATGHKTGANAMVRLVRSMLFRAKDWGLYEGDNPASRIKLFKEVKRDRFVTPDELPRLWMALQNEPNPYVRGAFIVGMLTGARRSEVLSMKWTDLDLRQGLWKIADTKAGRPHYVPLPTPMIHELSKLPRLNENPYVFCGRWGRDHLINVSKPWRRIRKEAGLDDVRIHDLRRTLGSWLVAAGASLPLIGKALNHSRTETTAIYARMQLDPVREALEANATRMLTVIEGAAKQEATT